MPDQKVHDQQHCDRCMTEDRTDLQMLEAPAQAGLECQAIEQRLKEDECGERSRLLVLEADLGQRTGLPCFIQMAASLCGLMCGNTIIRELRPSFRLEPNISPLFSHRG